MVCDTCCLPVFSVRSCGLWPGPVDHSGGSSLSQIWLLCQPMPNWYQDHPHALITRSRNPGHTSGGSLHLTFTVIQIKHKLHLLYIQGIKLTSEPSALKWSNACFLISPLIEPSNLYTNCKFRNVYQKSVDSISSFMVSWNEIPGVLLWGISVYVCRVCLKGLWEQCVATWKRNCRLLR